MQDLCEKLCKFYNTNFLDDQPEEIQHKFLFASLDNQGKGVGKQTLMNIIINHYLNTQKPIPLFISGPSNVTFHWSNKYEKMIYIFGENYSNSIDCDDFIEAEAAGYPIDTHNASLMSFEYFLGQFIKTTDKYLDVFLQFPALSDKVIRKYSEDFLPDRHLVNLFNQFKECIEFPTRGGESCKLARVHYFDTQSSDDNTSSNDTIGHFILHLGKVIKDYKLDGLSTIRDKYVQLSYDNNCNEVKKYMTEVKDDTEFEAFWILPLEQNAYVKKELDKLDQELKSKIVDYIKKEIIQRAHAERSIWKELRERIYKGSIDDVEDVLKNMLKSVSSVYSCVADAYLLARLFKTFNLEEMKEKAAYQGITDQPDTARNIIIYCGNEHAENIRRFLKNILAFNVIASFDNTNYRCVDMTAIQPLFVYPKTQDAVSKKVLVLCQRKAGLTYETDINKQLIPTLEKTIKTFLDDDTADIKYMVDINTEFYPQSKADFNMLLVTYNPEAVKFCEQHSQFYDLVVLQTCPFGIINMEMIRGILKEGGYVICTAVQVDGRFGKIAEQTQETISKNSIDAGFTKVSNDTLLTFQKKSDSKLGEPKPTPTPPIAEPKPTPTSTPIAEHKPTPKPTPTSTPTHPKKVKTTNLLENLTIAKFGIFGLLPNETRKSPNIKDHVIVDPAGLEYISVIGPGKAGSLSREIYNIIGLKGATTFPKEVKDTIKRTSDAKYHMYKKDKTEYHVIHTVGPDFRDNETISWYNAIKQLSKTYLNVLIEAEKLPHKLNVIHLPLISGGVFSGKFDTNDMIPELTARAIYKAFKDYGKKLYKNYWLCIYSVSDNTLARYREAFLRVDSVKHYDYKKGQLISSPNIKLDVKEIKYENGSVGYSTLIKRNLPDARIGVMIAGNSGRPGGAIGHGLDIIPRIDHDLIRQGVNGLIKTQEESIVSVWFKGEFDVEKEQEKLFLSTICGLWGQETNESGDETIQNVNYRNTQDKREYADAWVVQNASLLNKPTGNIIKASLVFVAGPNANESASNKRSGGSMYYTLNKKAIDDYNFFKDCVKESVRAGLLAMQEEGITHALVARVSCSLYAGNHEHNINKEFRDLVQDIVNNMEHTFREVTIVGIKSIQQEQSTKKAEKKKLVR